MNIQTRTLLLLQLITTATCRGSAKMCNVKLTCMNEPPRCTAKFNMGVECNYFEFHAAHVQFDYASTRFNCTMCQRNMCPCTVLTPNTSKSSFPEVTNTPSYNCNTTGVTDVSSSNITSMITSNCTYTTSLNTMDSGDAITTTNMNDSTSSRPTQSTANSTCSQTITRQQTTTTIIILTTTTTTTCSCDKDTTSIINSIQTLSIDPATTSSSSQMLTTSSISTTSLHSCVPVAGTLQATLHGVYMTVLLVLVAVTITMTTLVVYMCLMMKRAKSGRVPQTTTGTTHTNNMAASDYCEPISLKYVTTGTENVHMRTGNSCSDGVPDSAETTTGTPYNNMAASDYCEPVAVRRDKQAANNGTVEPATQGTILIQNHTYGHLNHHTHPPILNPPTSNNTVYSELTNTHKATPQSGGHEYEIVDEIRKDNTTSEVNVEEKDQTKKASNLDST